VVVDVGLGAGGGVGVSREKGVLACEHQACKKKAKQAYGSVLFVCLSFVLTCKMVWGMDSNTNSMNSLLPASMYR
jgi:hypothetical protein